MPSPKRLFLPFDVGGGGGGGKWTRTSDNRLEEQTLHMGEGGPSVIRVSHREETVVLPTYRVYCLQQVGKKRLRETQPERECAFHVEDASGWTGT